MFAFFTASSGLAGLLADAREFIAGVRFARPDALWLLLLLPLLGIVDRWAARRRRASVALIGRPMTVAGQLTHPVSSGRWRGLVYPVAWALLIFGVAGPRWGKSDETGVAIGRDLVIVIDLSRTMLAEDVNPPPGGWRVGEAGKDGPNDTNEERRKKQQQRREAVRWRAAREGALDLLDALGRRGGHRVGVVVFAARAKLLCPLTTDYDHARTILEDIDGEHRPLEIRPAPSDVVSGTRIGLALAAAIEAHDPRFTGSQDIVLISDGDDPGDDREWVRGSDRARDAGIPVHTVGVGNPDVGYVLVFGEELVQTKMQEAELKQIAAETRGHYVAARQSPPPLGEFFRTQVEPFPSRELTDDNVPQRKERYPWFLAPALVLFSLGWLGGRVA